MKQVLNFFDKLENFTREHLSRYPLTYAIFGGIFVVLFWRGVWETADMLSFRGPLYALFFFPPIQVIFSMLALMMTGLMVSVFVGDRIILSGLRREKKLEERTEELVKEEVVKLIHIRDEIRLLKKEIEDLKNKK